MVSGKPDEKAEPPRFKKISKPMTVKIKAAAASITGTVELLYFGQPTIGEAVVDTLQICQLIHEANPRIIVKVYDSESDKKVCTEMGVLFFPTLIIKGKNKGSLRFLGTPLGYQLPVLVDALKNASEGLSGLKPKTLEKLDSIKKDLNIKTFVTPVCPYCPRVSKLVVGLAIESPRVKAEIINAGDFTYVSKKYKVEGTPRTVVNEKLDIDGALHESDFMERLMAIVSGHCQIYQ